MTLSEFYSLPEEERYAIMMEVAKKAIDAQNKVMEQAEKMRNERLEEIDG